MTQGVKTHDDVEQEFRKHYLVTGNVAGSSRAAGIPVPTGYELRDRALSDPAFLEARKRIRDKIEPEVEQMAMCAMQICMERLDKDPEEILERLALAASGGDGKQGATRITFNDPGPAYAASFAKLMMSLTGAKRFEAEKNGEVLPERNIVIKVSGPAGAENDERAA